jgi:hypothetical protein
VWTRGAKLPVADPVARRVRILPSANPDTLSVTDRLPIGSGFDRVTFAHTGAGRDRNALPQAHRSPDATPDRGADPTPHGPPHGPPDREADPTLHPAADGDADADAAAEQTRPARPAHE